jgi:hypothetical protein
VFFSFLFPASRLFYSIIVKKKHTRAKTREKAKKERKIKGEENNENKNTDFFFVKIQREKMENKARYVVHAIQRWLFFFFLLLLVVGCCCCWLLLFVIWRTTVPPPRC